MHTIKERIITQAVERTDVATLNQQLYTINSDIEFSDILKSSWKSLQRNTDDPEKWIETGRNFKRQNLHREAIEAFSQGITNDCFNYLLFRHRAHSYLNICRYKEAVADFKLSVRMNPFHFDSWYLMGISYYLMQRYEEASDIFKQALIIADSDAEMVCTVYWRWFSLMLINNKQEADELLERVKPNLKLVSCEAFYKVLLICKGLLTPEQVLNIPDNSYTNAHSIMFYGVAQYYYLNGDIEKGNQVIEDLLRNEEERRWAGFAYQAAILEKNRNFNSKGASYEN
ncbi:tetratricopeptide repeat protein [Sedimentibacter hydroxybenzoicus DSM 7310]|uniref:Tetratricopeptide repeat protein n=1 Tax=Sedimentibacter hydroxybenzoicus DSM 7310 TaxID=1123245 RepID=A0A974BLY7_SEDHY|nr:tetratricopeptide repeat protein [Sedimentibacter hydroxybenzoicus]NYB75281.1 tetratricopeptide repeat protein [Sedimentibacter hydroxybenzoicus DSM 7310]